MVPFLTRRERFKVRKKRQGQKRCRDIFSNVDKKSQAFLVIILVFWSDKIYFIQVNSLAPLAVFGLNIEMMTMQVCPNIIQISHIVSSVADGSPEPQIQIEIFVSDSDVDTRNS